MSHESLGDRMKEYERASRQVLPRRLPLILRIDGKAFHTATRDCERPFDAKLIDVMNGAAVHLCEEAQGAVFGYVQSDEISVLLHNYKRIASDAWFDNEVQKLVSIAASMVAAYVSTAWKRVAFDARAFVLPEKEVVNYFIWRQQDATRNSIQMAARAIYTHAECKNKSTSEMQEMLHANGINWNDYPIGCKRGRAIVRISRSSASTSPDGAPIEVERAPWAVVDPPIFTQDRAFIERHLATEPEPER
jgi:tRNA(His) guanylyltransferase